MSSEFLAALANIEREKGIEKDILIEAIEAGLVSAYKKNFGTTHNNVRAIIEPVTGDFKVFALKSVKEIAQDSYSEISLNDAMNINSSIQIGDTIEIDVTPKQFGRIAAQTAKQIVTQRIREVERSMIITEFQAKEGEIVNGIVRRLEKRAIVVDLGKEVEGYIDQKEQIPGEEYIFNNRIKCYVLEVRDDPKGPKVMLSRTHPGIVKRLFELEVPEIYNGLVEIKNIAREPGGRTKMAVLSKDPNIDPVGSCVGQKGSRVQAVVDELSGEKIDIVNWNSSSEIFISNSLSPAEVIRVDIIDDNVARVVVPDTQLSLAIGKEGQNVRLAAKLTGWKIDIKSESQYRSIVEQNLLNFEDNFFNNNSNQEEDDDEYNDIIPEEEIMLEEDIILEEDN